METPQEYDHAHADLPTEDRGQKSPQFRGIRLREWGKWISEIRMPKSREKIYLGSYKTAEQAARAFDAAMYCLRGTNAKFNFPNSVPAIPSAPSLSRKQIRVAAAKYALNELPSVSTPLDNDSKEESLAPSKSSPISEMESSSDGKQISADLAFWKSLLAGSDGAEFLNLEKIPSIDEALALELNQISQEHYFEEADISVEDTGLWKFEDVRDSGQNPECCALPTIKS